MKDKKKLILLMSIFVLVVASFSVSAVYTNSYFQASQFSNPNFQGQGFPGFSGFDKGMCQAGQDFILQIDPLGCTPSPVRSDLLEEQNVPVFCQIKATQINPLIEVEAIDHISFQGEYPREVAGIGYQPARAALGRFGAPVGEVNSPLLNNLGYAVVVLRQQPNESAMPDFVSGNLTARIRYDIQNAFGVGQATYYLPVLDDEEWESQKEKYAFWQGRGHLRAESVEDNSARISIYSGTSRYSPVGGEIQRLQSVSLNEGQESGLVYMPGFDFCLGGMKLELEEVEDPDTRVRLRVNGDYFEFQDEEEFIEGRCKVKDINKDGLIQQADILCREDDPLGTKRFDLIINPEIKISVNGVTGSYSVGDRLPLTASEGAKSVYVAHMGSKDNFDTSSENLQVVLVALSNTGGRDRLTTEEISALERQIDGLNPDQITNILQVPIELFRGYASLVELSLKFLKDGQAIRTISYSDGNADVFDGQIQVLGYADAEDAPLSPEAQENYENAMEDYMEIIEAFSQEKYPPTETNPITLGEEAYKDAISLAEEMNQNEEVLSLCSSFEEDFPDASPGTIPEICDDSYKISSQASAVRDVEINGEAYRISFEGIREPSFDEYGATVNIRYPDGMSASLDLRKNKIIYLDDNGNEFIQLKEVDEDEITLRVQVNKSSLEAAKQFVLETENKVLRENSPDNFGGEYLFSLEETNLKKVAKVSVNPEINYAETQAEFPFKIGIEKRAFSLTPEQTRKEIEKVNGTLETLKGITNTLETGVRLGKAACTVTSGYLLAKNFFSNLGGDGIARQKVMRGDGGWYERCQELKNQGQYSDVDACLLDNNDEIESSVDIYSQEIQKINSELDNLEEGISETGPFGDSFVNTEQLFERYVDSSYKSEVVSAIENEFGQTINVGGEQVRVSEIIDGMDSNNVLISEARDLQLNSRLLSSGSEIAREVAASEIESELIEIWVNTGKEVNEEEFAQEYGFDESIIDVSQRQNEFAITSVKTFSQVRNEFDNNPIGINDTDYVYLYKKSFGDAQGDYLLVLSRNYNVIQTYFIGSNGLLSISSNENANPFNIELEFFDENTYKNEFKNAEIRFYGSGPYEGLPALVPFDLENGWYAATKSTLPSGGSIQAYDDSGGVSSFYLCNVGKNGREEFESGLGDDVCQMMNIGTGQPYNQFPGLEKSEASRLVDRAILAISQVSGKDDASSIRLFGQTIEVGNVYAGTPAIQCQDFMSPSDCNLLFNVCDPVVCPSSRCDLGGEYPVDNVVQSGIVGSSLLCLPNWPEVKVPVCLTGIHAGFEGLTTVFDSYQQCLQTSLETGQTVGICDEIRSVYMCDFFWKQARPIAEFAIPEVTGRVLGQGSGDGGEYLTAKDAFDRASDSASFLTDYYASNSFEAFKARSIESAGTEICQSWVSGAYPDIGAAFDALIAPDSPPQFHGTFEEMPFTTATSPPTSQYKVFYHIFAGKDSRANYQVYLKGTGSNFQTANFKRVVAAGFLDAGQYTTETEDFTAPSGYQELCIVVNGQEECGFEKVSTSFGVDYVNELYLQEQASQSNIETEQACISGTPSLLGSVTGSGGNLQTGVETAIDPELYNRGIVRVCATDNPGKGSDSHAGTESARWQDVGYCGEESLRCWLDTNSVKDVIHSTRIEGELLDEHAKRTLDALREEGEYIEDFESFIDGLEGLSALEIINEVTENLNNVFFNHEKAYLFLQRAGAFSELATKNHQENLKSRDQTVSEGEEDEEGEVTGIDESSGNTEEISCNSDSDCKQKIGERVIEIAQEIKQEKGISDSTVLEDTGAKNFECLALQVAYIESRIQHCEDDASSNFEGDPLYCQNLPDEVYCSPGEENSCGIMQINLDVHGDAIGNWGDFRNNVEYGLNLLADNYNPSDRAYRCYQQTSGDYVTVVYSGWERAIRSYNGWNAPPNCNTGNTQYVDQVLNVQDEVQGLFPETCV